MNEFLIYLAAFVTGGSAGMVLGRLLGFLILHWKHHIPWNYRFLFSGLRMKGYYDWLNKTHPDWFMW